MANEMRDRLRGLLLECGVNINTTSIATHLIENGVIVPQWISVSDRLPNEPGRYIVSTCNYRGEVGVFDLWFDYPEWYIDEDDDLYEFEVTHWMTLPEPPEAEHSEIYESVKTLQEFIADYIIADGWIRPPCKIGDTVYEVIAYKNKANNNRIDGHIRPCVVKSIHLSDRYSKKDEPYITLGAGGNYLHGAYIKRVSVDEFGKSIFPSEEQAEQKLKEMRGE